jgi:LysR family pca operon transcriptional activator
MVSGVIRERSGRTIALKSSSRWMGAVFALDKNSHSNVSTQPGRIARRYLDQRLRLSLLRAVDAVETHRSLLKASTVLGITQPALTKSLQELEDILQTRLFHRHSRGVRPTDAGLVFVQTARRILAEVRRLDDALDQLSSPGGTLALGALPVTAAGVLPGALIRLKATYPAIKLRLQEGRTEELLPLLVSGEIDLIIGRLYAPAVPDQFSREPLWTEPISILARAEHPIFSETVTVDVLRRYDLILPTGTQLVGQEIEHLLALLGLPAVTSLRSSSYGFIREMLHATDLISVMPRLMMVGDLLRGTLKVVPLPIPAPDRPAGVILPRDRPLSNAGRSFVQCLRAFVAEIAERGVAGIASRYSDAERSNTTHPDDQG